MADKIILLGAGGHAKVVLDCLGGKAHGFADDKISEFCGLNKVDDVGEGEIAMIGFGAVTLEDLERRHKVFLKYKAKNISFMTAIHKSAIIARDAKISEGAMIGPGAIINPGVTIGANVIINSGAVIEHDVTIGEGSHIAPGAIVLGAVKIGKSAMIGAGAVVLPGAKIPDWGLVKALSRFPS